MINLITHCRYYKGEEECPQIIIDNDCWSNWNYEKMWVEREDLRDEKSDRTEQYIEHGLKDFNTDDGTPFTLKALLYNRHSHWCGGYGTENDVASFKEWYLTSYLTNNI